MKIMQKIFSIDFSNNPITLTLNSVSNKDIRVEQVEYIDVDSDFYSSLIENKINISAEKKILDALKAFIKKVEANGGNNSDVVVLVPPFEQTSLNVTLPFITMPKGLDKIIWGEIQEMTPLSGDDWHVQYQILKKPKSAQDSTFHVSLLPENIFKNVLNLLNQVGIDPFVITTPASVLGVVNYLIDKNYFKQDAMIVEKWGDFIHVLYVHRGGQVHERCIPTSFNGVDVVEDNLLSQLKITLRTFEKDTNSQISTVYYGNNVNSELIKNLGKAGEPLDLYQLINYNGDKSKLIFASLSSFLAQDPMPFMLSNFRMGKFDCGIKMTEVMKIVKKFIPITILFVLCIIFSLTAFYFVREKRIDSIYKGILEAVSKEIPIKIEEGQDVIATVADVRNKLEDNLLQISSSYTVSPSKILEILSLDLSKIDKLEVKEFDFKTNQLKMSGVVQTYGDFEELEKILNKRKNIFKKIDAKQSSGRGGNGNVNFNLLISLED